VEPFECQWHYLDHGCLTVTNHDVMLQTSFKMDAFDENVGVISASLKPAGKFQMRLIQTGIDGTLQAKGESDTHSSDTKGKIAIQDTHSSDHKTKILSMPGTHFS